ncbi:MULTISPECIES: MoaF C-terminal domain-containing protein [unclassified Amycolatopsis]|uniref:MoaF C-terminal domain-containing protein n=1 Tax=unclassified Amycolatopsis TaxID=2618356 RepID=UPI00287B980F|nr:MULTISPECIES: MoaF C-terminal domain-containing protein [unclassified Amycolatopsis]
MYSEEHAYEHVDRSPPWYTWQCLAGPAHCLADTDENTVYQLRPGIYVFTWREKVIPCAAVTVADHRNAHDLAPSGRCSAWTRRARTPRTHLRHVRAPAQHHRPPRPSRPGTA